ncbi:MAG: hypothetical protein ABIL18_07530, partial [candidate division WOR-3 bacterium]
QPRKSTNIIAQNIIFFIFLLSLFYFIKPQIDTDSHRYFFYLITVSLCWFSLLFIAIASPPLFY